MLAWGPLVADQAADGPPVVPPLLDLACPFRTSVGRSSMRGGPASASTTPMKREPIHILSLSFTHPGGLVLPLLGVIPSGSLAMAWCSRSQMLGRLLVVTLLGNVAALATFVTPALKAARTTTRACLHQRMHERVRYSTRVLGMFGLRPGSILFLIFVHVFSQCANVPV